MVKRQSLMELNAKLRGIVPLKGVGFNRRMKLAEGRLRAKCPLLDQSGQTWILARDGLSAFDPKRTWEGISCCSAPGPYQSTRLSRYDAASRAKGRIGATSWSPRYQSNQIFAALIGVETPCRNTSGSVVSVLHRWKGPPQRSRTSDLRFRKPFRLPIYQWLTPECCKCVASVSAAV